MMQVNNAAVCFNALNENSVDHAETVINTNYYGSKLFTEAMLPFVRCSYSMSRILNISSRLGILDVRTSIVQNNSNHRRCKMRGSRGGWVTSQNG